MTQQSVSKVTQQQTLPIISCISGTMPKLTNMVAVTRQQNPRSQPISDLDLSSKRLSLNNNNNKSYNNYKCNSNSNNYPNYNPNQFMKGYSRMRMRSLRVMGRALGRLHLNMKIIRLKRLGMKIIILIRNWKKSYRRILILNSSLTYIKEIVLLRIKLSQIINKLTNSAQSSPN